MGRRCQPVRTVRPEEIEPGNVVLFRVAGQMRWLLLDEITGQGTEEETWHGRLVYVRTGRFDGSPLSGPADAWHRRCAVHEGRCVIKNDDDAAAIRYHLNELREDQRCDT